MSTRPTANITWPDKVARIVVVLFVIGLVTAFLTDPSNFIGAFLTPDLR